MSERKSHQPATFSHTDFLNAAATETDVDPSTLSRRQSAPEQEIDLMQLSRQSPDKLNHLALAHVIADEAISCLSEIDFEYDSLKGLYLREAVSTVAQLGEYEWAHNLLTEITDTDDCIRALAALMKAGDESACAQAEQAAKDIGSLARLMGDNEFDRENAFNTLAEAYMEMGRTESAFRMAQYFPAGQRKIEIFGRLAVADPAIVAVDTIQAQNSLFQSSDARPDLKARAWAALIPFDPEALEQATSLLDLIDNSTDSEMAYFHIIQQLTATKQYDAALALARRPGMEDNWSTMGLLQDLAGSSDPNARDAVKTEIESTADHEYADLWAIMAKHEPSLIERARRAAESCTEPNIQIAAWLRLSEIGEDEALDKALDVANHMDGDNFEFLQVIARAGSNEAIEQIKNSLLRMDPIDACNARWQLGYTMAMKSLPDWRQVVDGINPLQQRGFCLLAIAQGLIKKDRQTNAI